MPPAPQDPAAPGQGYAVGDLLPRFVLPDRHGGKLDFGHQSRSGRAVVLAIGARRDAAMLDQALSDLTGDDEALLHVICAGVGPGDPCLTSDRMLPDPAGLMPKAFGVAPPAWVVLDPALRIAFVGAHGAGTVAEVAAMLTRLAERNPSRRVKLQAPVLIVPDLFEPELCERLLAYWRAGRKVADLVSASGANPASHRTDKSLKRRTDVPVDDETLTREIRRRLVRRALPQVTAAFQRTVDHFETFRIGCYDAADGGHFGRHRDNTTPFTAHRLFALTANLNGDYEGGELVFPEFGAARYRPDPGGAVIFSCSLLHEARPVTAGRRFGLFGFLFDRAGAEQVSRVMAQERAAGRDPEAAWR